MLTNPDSKVKLPRLEDADLMGKRVLLRADFNVTFEPGTTNIADDSRIHASMPTIELLRRKGASVILCSHLGRPKGRVVPDMRIEPVRARTSDALGAEVEYLGGPTGDGVAAAAEKLNAGDVAMLENLRFDQGEEANEPHFSAALASLADIYVNDAFGASHRAHASIVGVAELLPTFAGLLMRTEIEALERAVSSEERPAIAILGGAKVADKLGVVNHLAPRVDSILIGGGMVAAILAAQGKFASSTTAGDDEINAAQGLIEDAALMSKLVLPQDVIFAEEFSEQSDYRIVGVNDIAKLGFLLDIGPKTAQHYANIVSQARKIVWNGPMGLFEWPAFAQGTAILAKSIAGNRHAFKLAGGGSTVEAINTFGVADDITHVSTGGGASLEYLEGKTLPGIAALRTEVTSG